MAFKNTSQRSWWEKESMSFTRDLIVVGSGITGLSTALFWKRRHPQARILVLDRGFWPTGATGRNAGFACFGSAGELVDDLVHESEESVKDRLRLRLEGLDLLRNELGDEHIGYAMTGGYEIFDTTDDPHYRESIAQMPRFSKWVEEITGVPNSYESRTVNGYPSIFNGLEGYLNSGMLMQRLLQKVSEAGVEVRWNTPVSEVMAQKVTLSDGLELAADRVLLATNGYSSTLHGETAVQPARGYAFVTKPLKKLPWHGSCHYNRGYVYFRDLGDRLLIGGARDVDKPTETSIENEINPRIRQWLIDFVSNQLNVDHNWEIDTEWTGVMGFGATKTPECRKTSDGVYLAAGLGGMGVAIGMKLAQNMVQLLDEEQGG
ncbi:MAG: FAD-binding oxidoreductase [Bacteroidetes bacterium]|nr:FAD-binding oxidoreductase [Bacteroidota bacterium]MCH8523586.1 FAD-binding oxidoreductase [Balneolales bacterium]